jgi:cytochrome c oxidase subunit 3
MATTTYTQTESAVRSRPTSQAVAATKGIPSQTGIWVAVSAIAMSFAALTSALVVRQGSGTDWLRFSLPRILYLNTLILIASSFTLELARRRFSFPARQPVPAGGSTRPAHATAEQSAGLYWLNITLTLGLFFVAGQFLAWRALAKQGLFLATSPSSSFFYVLTATHGLHLLGGVMGLLYVVSRLRRRTRNAQVSFDTAAVYWHFVDLLWIYLLMVIAIRM